jgi:chromate reductase, NAD(P)H dehydrogenase (quinone)
MMQKKVIVIAGSTRRNSYNVSLAKVACAMAQQEGLEAEWIDLTHYPLPLFNQDDEAETGMPEAAKALKETFTQADGIIFVTPEYNGMFTPLLKNMLDWLSRPHQEGEASLSAFQHKSAAIMAASPGALGGLRALVPLRLQLANLGIDVLGSQLALGKAYEAFTETGELKDEKMQAMVHQIIAGLKRLL